MVSYPVCLLKMAAAVQKTVWETESAFMAQWHPIPNIRNVHTDHQNLWHVLASHGAEDVYNGISRPPAEGKYLKKSICTKAPRESDIYPVFSVTCGRFGEYFGSLWCLALYVHLAFVCVVRVMCLDGAGSNISYQLLLSLHKFERRVHSLFLAA